MVLSAGKSLAGLSLLSLIVIVPVLAMEVMDCDTLNKYFDAEIRSKKNEDCITYIQHYTNKPTWRRSMFMGMCIALFSAFIMLFLSPSTTSHTLVLFYLCTMLFNFVLIYKFYGTDFWHCLCNRGCMQKHPPSTKHTGNTFQIALASFFGLLLVFWIGMGYMRSASQPP